ncbi:hypothetical protein MHTCC0001_35290 [Flavobacteriaceae bacterium MHTCC 0001]
MNLTTDSLKYYFEINKRLISEFDTDWIPLWNYCEMTSMLIEGHSWTFLIKDGLENRKLIYRNWKNSEQNSKNDLGVFSLEDIKIVEKELSISLNEVFEIQNILKSDLTINRTKRIVLDGVRYELTDFKTERKYEWKLDEEMNSNCRLSRFVAFPKA